MHLLARRACRRIRRAQRVHLLARRARRFSGLEGEFATCGNLVIFGRAAVCESSYLSACRFLSHSTYRSRRWRILWVGRTAHDERSKPREPASGDPRCSVVGQVRRGFGGDDLAFCPGLGFAKRTRGRVVCETDPTPAGCLGPGTHANVEMRRTKPTSMITSSRHNRKQILMFGWIWSSIRHLTSRRTKPRTQDGGRRAEGGNRTTEPTEKDGGRNPGKRAEGEGAGRKSDGRTQSCIRPLNAIVNPRDRSRSRTRRP